MTLQDLLLTGAGFGRVVSCVFVDESGTEIEGRQFQIFSNQRMTCKVPASLSAGNYMYIGTIWWCKERNLYFSFF